MPVLTAYSMTEKKLTKNCNIRKGRFHGRLHTKLSNLIYERIKAEKHSYKMIFKYTSKYAITYYIVGLNSTYRRIFVPRTLPVPMNFLYTANRQIKLIYLYLFSFLTYFCIHNGIRKINSSSSMSYKKFDFIACTKWS